MESRYVRRSSWVSFTNRARLFTNRTETKHSCEDTHRNILTILFDPNNERTNERTNGRINEQQWKRFQRRSDAERRLEQLGAKIRKTRSKLVTHIVVGDGAKVIRQIPFQN